MNATEGGWEGVMRDPKVNPHPGDVLLGEGGVRLVSVKPAHAKIGGLIWYKTVLQNECNAFPDSWERWAKNAEVLAAGLDPEGGK